MSDEIKVINSGNVEIQHNIHVKDEDALRKECVGIMLEIIKSSAAAGTHPTYINQWINQLGENAEIIFKAITKK